VEGLTKSHRQATDGAVLATIEWKRGKRREVAQLMGWERGYYYRVRKVNGRVLREYVGTGPVAELIAESDALERERQKQKTLALRRAKAELAALDAELKALAENTDLVTRAALLAAGYRQHNRGEWRKQREPVCPAD
jgi:hypothetical protein